MGFTQFSFFLPGHHDMWCLGVSSVVVQHAFCIIQLFGCRRKVLFVLRKVRFLAMTMSEQARRCSFGLTKTFFSRFSKSAFSRHDNVRASLTLFIWLNENVRLWF